MGGKGSSAVPRDRDIDVKIGAKVRARRILIGMSQDTLGERIGVSFQQIQKYEKGTNAMAPARLVAIAEVLDLPISYLFDEDPVLAAKRIKAIAKSAPAARAEDGIPAEVLRNVKAIVSGRQVAARATKAA